MLLLCDPIVGEKLQALLRLEPVGKAESPLRKRIQLTRNRPSVRRWADSLGTL